MARGTVSLAPTPEDPVMDAVGRFYWSILEIERRCATERYMTDPEGVRARRLGQTVNQFRKMQDRVLLKLAGFLLAGVFTHK
jgi:CII-binding regulator of phage lambda lysogenization HflD